MSPVAQAPDPLDRDVRRRLPTTLRCRIIWRGLTRQKGVEGRPETPDSIREIPENVVDRLVPIVQNPLEPGCGIAQCRIDGFVRAVGWDISEDPICGLNDSP
jgi:hypothetical protein